MDECRRNIFAGREAVSLVTSEDVAVLMKGCTKHSYCYNQVRGALHTKRKNANLYRAQFQQMELCTKPIFLDVFSALTNSHH